MLWEIIEKGIERITGQNQFVHGSAQRQIKDIAADLHFLMDGIGLLTEDIEREDAADWDGAKKDYELFRRNESLRARSLYRCKSRYHTKSKWMLEEACKDQPAGTPVYIGKPGLNVVLSPSYGDQKNHKKVRQQRRSKRRLMEEESYKKRQKSSAEPGLSAPEKEKKLYNRWRLYLDRHGYFVRRSFWSDRLQRYIYIEENYLTGKCRLEKCLKHDRFPMKAMLYMNTYEAAQVYSVEAEMKAMECLKGKVTDEQFKRYYCTGTLVERSKKSKLIYIFRRCRPIIVMKEILDELDGESDYKFIAALCIHPQGYYSLSWAGTLVPTDDIICQLLMMRCEEPRLWRKSTHHDQLSPQANI